jgi:hypothetical protein
LWTVIIPANPTCSFIASSLLGDDPRLAQPHTHPPTTHTTPAATRTSLKSNLYVVWTPPPHTHTHTRTHAQTHCSATQYIPALCTLEKYTHLLTHTFRNSFSPLARARTITAPQLARLDLDYTGVDRDAVLAVQRDNPSVSLGLRGAWRAAYPHPDRPPTEVCS